MHFSKFFCIEHAHRSTKRSINDYQVKGPFALPLRVIVPGNETEDNILLAVKKKLEDMFVDDLIKLILENLDTITDSQKPYNKKKDYEEEDMMWDDEDDWDDENDES